MTNSDTQIPGRTRAKQMQFRLFYATIRSMQILNILFIINNMYQQLFEEEETLDG